MKQQQGEFPQQTSSCTRGGHLKLSQLKSKPGPQELQEKKANRMKTMVYIQIYIYIYLCIYWYFCKNLSNINMSLESGGCKFPQANLTCCAVEHSIHSSVERSTIATKLACWPLIGQIPVKFGFSCTCGLTCLSVSRQISQSGDVKRKPLPKKVGSMSQADKTFTAVPLVLVTDLKFFPEPPVQFLNPPEQVEVRVGERARLHCEFRSSSFPVACCWIYNRDKVKKWV